MKNINFKKYKFFTTIFKNINFKRYKLSTAIFKNINFKGYKSSAIFKNINFKGYKSSAIFKNINFKRYKFSTIFKNINFKRYNYIGPYVAGLLVFIAFVYLNIPMFFNYEKSKIEDLICKELNVKCFIQGKIKYSFLPSPRIKFNNFIIKDFIDKNKILGEVENVEINISLYNLHDKQRFDFTKINLINAQINFDLEKFDKYKDFSKKKFNTKPISLKKGAIKFYEGKKNIAVIKNADFKFTPSENIDKATLKGGFLGDKIYISFENDKNDNKPSKTFILKLFDLKLFTKINIFNSNLDKNIISGDILFKEKRNRISAMFDYKDNRIIVKKANLRNFFANGQFNGEIRILPYFNFDLNLDLERINFNKLYNFLVGLDEKNKKNLFKVNNKINGQLNLSADKIYSKYSLIKSFESRLKFLNGNILFDQLLLSFGKLGAADITGIIKNEKKFTNFKFENNIFLDNLKSFGNKFGIYNKKDIPFNLFISGNFDLANLNMRLDEISDEQKLRDEDVAYIEKEFNNLVLENGYASLFDFLKLKEFVKLVTTEIN